MRAKFCPPLPQAESDKSVRILRNELSRFETFDEIDMNLEVSNLKYSEQFSRRKSRIIDKLRSCPQKDVASIFGSFPFTAGFFDKQDDKDELVQKLPPDVRLKVLAAPAMTV